MGIILESRSSEGIYYLTNRNLQKKLYRGIHYYWSNNNNDPCIIFTSKARALNSFKKLCERFPEFKEDKIRFLNSETLQEV